MLSETSTKLITDTDRYMRDENTVNLIIASLEGSGFLSPNGNGEKDYDVTPIGFAAAMCIVPFLPDDIQEVLASTLDAFSKREG